MLKSLSDRTGYYESSIILLSTIIYKNASKPVHVLNIVRYKDKS